jgi:hypothetical protein
MNHPDGGRLGEFAIDHHQMFDNVGRDAKHRELELAMLGRQAKERVQGEMNDRCGLNGFYAEMRSVGENHGKEADHRAALKGVAIDRLANAIEERAFESAGDDEVNALDF